MIHGGIVGGYYGISGANPVAYYYGKDQTKRVGENYTPGGEGDDRAAEFKTIADEVLDGGKRDLLRITNASDASNIDLTNGPDNSILQFPVGRHHLFFQGYSEAVSQAAFRVELRKIQEETDDTEIVHTTGWTGAPSPARTVYQLIWLDFVVTDDTEKFYFLFPIGGNSNRSNFLRIETVI